MDTIQMIEDPTSNEKQIEKLCTETGDQIVENQLNDTSNHLNNLKFVSNENQNVKESNSSSGASSSNSSFELVKDNVEMETADTCNNRSDAEIINGTNSSLCNLLVYTSGESSNSDSEDSDSYECESEGKEETLSEKPTVETVKKKKSGSLFDTLKKMGELSIDDLPPVTPVSEINVLVKEEDCDEIGKIASIVDKLVMVESIPNKPAFDIDTLLFLQNGKQPLGYIFDVIGAVACPMYAIRFNTIEEISALNIIKGQPVYSAPKTEHTQYVFVQQLLKAKGSDASWKDDLEVPQEHQDYSDDEAECYKNNTESRKRNSLERYQTFEKDMNVKNLIDTRLHKIRDNYEPIHKKHTPNNNYKRGYYFQPNYRPNFGFTQANVSNTLCAFPPPFGMPPYMSTNMPLPPPYGPQNTPPPFVPNMPPPHSFVHTLPPPIPNLTPFPYQMQQNVQFPTHDMVNGVYPNVHMPPNTSQPKNPQSMMYPSDMNLPRPPSQNPSFVPNMPFYDPRVRMRHNFPNTTPNTRQPFHRSSRNQFPRRQ